MGLIIAITPAAAIRASVDIIHLPLLASILGSPHPQLTSLLVSAA